MSRPVGWHHTDETRRKISEAHKRKKQSKETIEKRVAQFKGEKNWTWKGGGITKKCEECGKEFTCERSREKTARFCSPKCRAIWMSKTFVGENSSNWQGGGISKQCEECGKEFIVERAREKTARFCSTACKGKWQSENTGGEKNPYWQGGGVTKKCEECGKEFTCERSREKTAKFCSPKCRADWMSKNFVGEKIHNWRGGPLTKICEECGNEFVVERTREKTAKFCSSSCHGKWMSKNLVGENHPNYGKPGKYAKEKHWAWKGGEIAINCEECGKEFKIKRSQIAEGGRRNFCSVACRSVWMSKNFVGEKIHNWKGGPLTKICEICGNEFVVERAREITAKFCSPNCRAIWMSKTFVGENNWNWTGGLKDYCEKWNAEFRRRIRAFFDYTCVECGTLQGEKLLHCHHVYYDKKACCNVNKDGIYFSNLGMKGTPYTFEINGEPNKFVALCDSCHKKTGGKKNREYWARHFEEIINNYYLGRSYFTKEEYEKLR